MNHILENQFSIVTAKLNKRTLIKKNLTLKKTIYIPAFLVFTYTANTLTYQELLAIQGDVPLLFL